MRANKNRLQNDSYFGATYVRKTRNNSVNDVYFYLISQ